MKCIVPVICKNLEKYLKIEDTQKQAFILEKTLPKEDPKKKDIMKETDDIIKPVIRLLEELKTKFNSIEPPKRYYRNKHLKSYFGLSDNTIISYRDKNLLPFTKIGEIYYYPIAEIENILTQNSNFDFWFYNLRIE